MATQSVSRPFLARELLEALSSLATHFPAVFARGSRAGCTPSPLAGLNGHHSLGEHAPCRYEVNRASCKREEASRTQEAEQKGRPWPPCNKERAVFWRTTFGSRRDRPQHAPRLQLCCHTSFYARLLFPRCEWADQFSIAGKRLLRSSEIGFCSSERKAL